jgi:16S rRNA (guanine527-N7)-methyltransferase
MPSTHLAERISKVAPDADPAGLLAWLDTLSTWNQKLDLTAARDDDELVDLMVADAAELAARVAQGARVVDVGSGAGAPGLALALLRPDLEVTLVEPMQKRAALLRMMKGSLPSARVTILQERGERVAGRWDVALSRATLAPPRWLELGARLAPEVWVLLAREEPPLLEGWTLAIDARYRWPLTGAERRLACYRC